MSSSHKCNVFAYYDQQSHDDISSCGNSMDLYYGANVEGVTCLYCARCKFLSRGPAFKSAFYRDHEDHLERSREDDGYNKR